MLEDRIYEYDAAYQQKDAEYESLVQQLARLKKKNAELQQKLNGQKIDEHSSSPTGGLSLKPSKRPQSDLKPSQPAEPSPSNRYEPPSVLNPEIIETPPPVVSKTPVAPPALNNNNSASPSTEDLLPPGSNSSLQPPALPPPAQPDQQRGLLNEPRASSEMRPTKKQSMLPSPESLTEQVSMPESMVRSAQQPKLMTAPGVQPDVRSNPTPNESTQRSNSVPSLLPVLQRRFPNIKDGNSQGAIERGMIRLPEGSKVQFASAVEPLQNDAPKKAVDQKMVEIAFHPTMCRGHNFDDKPGDDGLYLVVTPMNSAGQVVNQTGTLTVVVEDPAAPKEEARVGAWEFTPEQLDELLEPVGASQGFHLRLPWTDKVPSGKVVSVYILHTSATGRKLVNQREVHLRIPSSEQPIWTPRKE